MMSTTIRSSHHPRSCINFHILGVDSGVGVEVYKYSFFEDERTIQFLKQVALANPDVQIQIEFSSFFDDAAIEQRVQAAEDPIAVMHAAMDLIRKAVRLRPDMIVGACNTLNAILISKQYGKSPYQALIEEGTLTFNPDYTADIVHPFDYGMVAPDSEPVFSCGIIDATAKRIYQKSIYGRKDNVIDDPVVTNSDSQHKAAIIIFSTKRTAQEGVYRRSIEQLHEENSQIELDIIEKGVSRARWLNTDPDPTGQTALIEQIELDVSALVDQLLEAFSINELLEMSPIQVSFCCTHFPLVKELVMEAFDDQLVDKLEQIAGRSQYTYKNEVDQELIDQILAWKKQVDFQAIVQGPDLLTTMKAQFERTYQHLLNAPMTGSDFPVADNPISNISLLSSVYGRTGENLPISSFVSIGQLKQPQLLEKFATWNIEPKFDIRYEERI